MIRYLALILALLWAVAAQGQAVLGGQSTNSAPPSNSTGGEGSWYIDFVSGNIFGPKSFGRWSSIPASTFAVAGTGTLVPISSGGTGATTAPAALTNLGAAASGANHDITSLTALTNTNQFWTQNGANILRAGDRLFVGGATANDGALPNVSQDWLAQLQLSWGSGAYTQGATLSVLTQAAGSGGVLGGAQTSTLTTQAAIGVEAFGISNNATTNGNTWGFYGEAHQVTGTGAASGMELDPVAHQNNATLPTPNIQGTIRGIQIGCGGGYQTGITIYPCSVGIQFVANNQAFETAINVIRGSVVGTNPAISLPTGNGIAFYDAAGHQSGSVKASFTSTNVTGINFNDTGLQVYSAGGTAVAYFVAQTSSAVNYLTFAGALTGANPIINATGTDTNVGLTLQTKGTGTLRVLNLPTSAGTGGLYVCIDSSGNMYEKAACP